jgi:hypothetical protein
LKCCAIAFCSVWLAFSLTLATMVFPAQLQASVLCDVVDDDSDGSFVCALQNSSTKDFSGREKGLSESVGEATEFRAERLSVAATARSHLAL